MMTLTDQQLTNIKKWTTAMKSGVFTQITGTYAEEDGYCAIGVGINIFGGLQEFCEATGLGMDPFVHGREISTNVIYANDELGWTFDDIADAVERTFINNCHPQIIETEVKSALTVAEEEKQDLCEVCG